MLPSVSRYTKSDFFLTIKVLYGLCLNGVKMFTYLNNKPALVFSRQQFNSILDMV